MQNFQKFLRTAIGFLLVSTLSSIVPIAHTEEGTSEAASATTWTDPAAPTVDTIPDVTLSCGQKDVILTFHGTGTPGANVKLRTNNVTIITGIIDKDGNWTLSPTLHPFSLGAHSVKVYSWTDLYPGGPISSSIVAGNTIDFAVSENCNPTHTPPTLNKVPDVELSCKKDGVTDIHLGGTGTPGAAVTVTKSNGTVVGSAIINGSGSWWVVSTHVFSEGTYTLTATSVLDTSTLSSTPISFTVTKASSCGGIPNPIPPTIVPQSDVVLECKMDSKTLTFSGSGTPGAPIKLKIDGNIIAQGIIPATGVWTLTPDYKFMVGNYTVISYTWPIDAAGSPSGGIIAGGSTTFLVKSGTCPPTHTPPTLNKVPDVELSCKKDGVTDIHLGGTGTPGAAVTVTKSNGTVVGSAIINGSGSWWVVSTHVFTEGTYTLTATSVLDTSTLSSTPISFTVTGAKNCHTPPTVNQLSAIKLPCDATYASGVLFSGNGSSGAQLTLKTSSGIVIGTTTVAANGSWSLSSSITFAPGTHTVKAFSVLGGTTQHSSLMTFIVKEAKNCDPSHTPPFIVDPEDITLNCGQTGTTISLTGTGTPGASVSIKNASGTTVGTALVNASGQWSLTPSTSFPVGTHIFSVESTLSGNVITGNSISVNVNPAKNCTPTHLPPTIAPLTDVTLSCSETTRSVVLSGTGTAGATITIKNASGTTIGTIPVDSNGNWTLSTSNTVGTYTFTVYSTLGGATLTGNTVSYTVSPATGCGPVHTVSIKPIANHTLACGSTTHNVTLTGSGSSGATITVKNASGSTIGTATVDSSGNWTLSTANTAGTYTYTVYSTLGGKEITGNTVSYTVSPATDCGISHTTPTISVSSAIVPCGETTSILTVTGNASSGATVTIKNNAGTVLGTALVGSSGTYSINTSALGLGSHTIYASSTLDTSTLRSADATISISQTSCGGGGGPSPGPGPGGFTPITPVIQVTPKPVTPIITVTVVPKKTTTIKPYWVRFPQVNPPQFLPTGPSANLVKKTKTIASKRVMTTGESYTSAAQKKNTSDRFKSPLSVTKPFFAP